MAESVNLDNTKVDFLTEEQRNHLKQLIKSDDVVAIEKLLRDGIETQKDGLKTTIQLRETPLTFGSYNLLHHAANKGAVKCVRLLVNPPHSWNVDLPDEDGWSSMHVGRAHHNPEVMVIMARFSAQLRPYPAEFMIFGSGEIIQFITTYLLWPQVALFDQPMRMIFDIKKKIKGTNFTVMARETNNRGYALYNHYYEKYFGLFCELLLANAEINNDDVMGDNRLPYTKITNIDSSRMWPIMPLSEDFVNEHLDCIHYPRCLERGHRNISPDVWKFHRFGRIVTDLTNEATRVFIWGPPTLKEFSRLVIRRCMVRRVEPLNNNSEEYMFPNQAILLRYVPLPLDLKEYMLFTDLPKSSYFNLHYVPGWSFWDTPRKDIPRYGPGTALRQSFVPDAFETFYPRTDDW